MGQPGLENAAATPIGHVSSSYNEPVIQKDGDMAQKAAIADAIGPAIGPGAQDEVVLMRTIDAAAAAGNFDLVDRLARELEARRRERLAGSTELVGGRSRQ